jgi:hypothetical protein
MAEKKDQIVLLVVTSVLLLFSPIILEFDTTSSFMGVPALFAYVFFIWAGIIVFTYLISRKNV